MVRFLTLQFICKILLSNDDLCSFIPILFYTSYIYTYIYMYNIHSIPVYIFFNPEALSHLCESASGFKKILTEML